MIIKLFDYIIFYFMKKNSKSKNEKTEKNADEFNIEFLPEDYQFHDLSFKIFFCWW